MTVVTVALPVRNAGELLGPVLHAVTEQDVAASVELLVADTGSHDGSGELARSWGATVIDVPPDQFSHGGTRNLLMERSRGSYVAFITQDAVPAHRRWLAKLLEGFELAADVALVFGPYLPRPTSSPMVRRELEAMFASFSPDEKPRVDHADSQEQGTGLGRKAYFTDANGCVAKAAWERVPYRPVPYAEDQALARDMLAAGYAKAYQPEAAVIHSHDYRPAELFRRSFDEWRALAEIHALRAPVSPVRMGLSLQREVRDDLGLVRAEGAHGLRLARWTAASLRHHALRSVGAALGSRAERLPASLRRLGSLEGRG
jgi:glycosyltransferase involved in cell wall biosynthesis